MRTHFRFGNSFLTAALMTVAARLQSLRDSAAVTARQMLGRAYELLPAEAARTHDPHALRKYLVPRYPAGRVPRLRFLTMLACTEHIRENLPL
jgi:hypothetical protein